MRGRIEERAKNVRSCELELPPKGIGGCVKRGRARRIPGPLVVLLAQPGLKALAAKRPRFPVAADGEIRKAGAVACVKEPGGRCDIEDRVRACLLILPNLFLSPFECCFGASPIQAVSF
jgi:hypothetical protein